MNQSLLESVPSFPKLERYQGHMQQMIPVISKCAITQHWPAKRTTQLSFFDLNTARSWKSANFQLISTKAASTLTSVQASFPLHPPLPSITAHLLKAGQHPTHLHMYPCCTMYFTPPPPTPRTALCADCPPSPWKRAAPFFAKMLLSTFSDRGDGLVWSRRELNW